MQATTNPRFLSNLEYSLMSRVIFLFFFSSFFSFFENKMEEEREREEKW